MAIPILGNILQIAAVVFCAGAVVCAGLVASLSSAFVSGVTSGKLGYALRSGLISAVTAVAFYAVGNVTNAVASVPASDIHVQPQFGTSAYAVNIAGHAVVGCSSTAASGGSCGSGALSGAVGSAAGPLVSDAFPNARTDTAQFLEGAAATSALGGLASVAGGGKFANGAATAAFGYLFNQMAGRGAVFGMTQNSFNSTQALSLLDPLNSFLRDNLGITFYIGGGAEYTRGEGVAGAAGIYFYTKDNAGFYSSGSETSGFNSGPSAGAGFQFGLADTFAGKGYSANLSTSFISGSLTLDSQSQFNGIFVGTSGKAGVSYVPTTTCLGARSMLSGC